MTQTYKMKHNPQGTIYSLLTVESDGRMTLTFYGRDREISHEVTENEDGWLCYPGGTFPGLASGRWQVMADERCQMDEVNTTTDDVETTDNAVAIAAEEPTGQEQRTDTDYTDDMNDTEVQMQTQCVERFTRENSAEPITHESRPQPSPQPKRQRKPRKPATAVQHRTANHATPSLTDCHNDYAWLRSAGYLAAASVALLLIWETGLIIPLGLIGLATGGLLK